MPKNNIVLIGGGFAGVNALKHLSKYKDSFLKDFRLILIDRKYNFEFLPMLPDIIGHRVRSSNLLVDLSEFARMHGFEFIKGEVTGINLERRELNLTSTKLNYEYLIICSGSETNFFNNENARINCLKLDSVADGLSIRGKILERVKQREKLNIIIIGGGYTGVEIATNIDYLLRNRVGYKIYLLEVAQDILMMVPEWIRKDVRGELKNSKIEIICNDSIKISERENVLLGSGKKMDNAFCIWAAGAKTSSFVENMRAEKENTRIKVKEDLRFSNGNYDNVFIAGDAAYFMDNKKNSPLRMAVMFSVNQGKIAAQNVINSVLNRPLVEYTPVDLGYLIPMAHGKAAGKVLGFRVRGLLGYIMHYYMCIYRSERQNKKPLFKDIFLNW